MGTPHTQARGAEIQGPPIKGGKRREKKWRPSGGGNVQADILSAPGMVGRRGGFNRDIGAASEGDICEGR